MPKKRKYLSLMLTVLKFCVKISGWKTTVALLFYAALAVVVKARQAFSHVEQNFWVRCALNIYIHINRKKEFNA